MKVCAIFVAVLFCTVNANDVKYKDCGSVSGTIESIDITPCPQEPCPFKRSTTINVTVDFTAKVAISSATTKVYGFIAGVKVPFPVASDACKDMTCPIAAGAKVTYKNSVDVKPEYPNVSVVVQWEVRDQDGKDIICFNVPVQISN